MPASLYNQSNCKISSEMEDNRAVKLAYELAMLGLDNSSALRLSLDNDAHLDTDQLTSLDNVLDTESLKSRKSQNMTECVPVPTSEHVAEIVGRQGQCSPPPHQY